MHRLGWLIGFGGPFGAGGSFGVLIVFALYRRPKRDRLVFESYFFFDGKKTYGFGFRRKSLAATM